MLKINLLEFGYRETTMSSMGVVSDIIDYTVMAEQAGISRFWLGEHHNYNALSPYSSPEILLPVLLSNTSSINIGVAGVLLNFYSPYKVALNYKLLSNMFSERVDLGFANGHPKIEVVRLLLNKEIKKYPAKFYKNLTVISKMLHDENFLVDKCKVILPPFGGSVPNMFLLSSTFNNFEIAVKLKLNYSRSLFHAKSDLIYEKDRIIQFSEAYESANGKKPFVNLAIILSCSSSKAKATKNLNDFARANGGIVPINAIVGDKYYLQDQLLILEEKFGITEFTFLDCPQQQKDKLKTLEYLNQIIQ